MDVKYFDELVERRIAIIRKSLIEKAKQYASDSDRLHNFKESARVDRSSPEDVLFGFMVKQWVGLTDLIKNKQLDTTLIEEYIKDLINYLILLYAIYIEKVNESKRKSVEENSK